MTLEQEVKIWAEILLDDIKRGAPKDTGNLANELSYKYNIIYSLEQITIDIYGPDYGNYLDMGVNGTEVSYTSTPFGYTNKKPPISALVGWSKRKGISPYAVQNSIYKKGIKPTKFITKHMDTLNDKLTDRFIGSIWDEFEKRNFK